VPFGRVLLLLLAFLALGRLALTADLSPLIVFAPHDDGLYVGRALHLMQDGTFGPYDSRVLAKLPGMSYLLAGLRRVGLPYFTMLNLLYIAAGVYVVAGLRRSGTGAVAILVVFTLYLFNPVSMGAEWIRVLREPPSTVLLVAILGAMLHVLARLRSGEPAWRHMAVLGALLSTSMLLREEDVLLWGLLGLFALALWACTGRAGTGRRRRLWHVAVLVAIPVVTIVTVNQAARFQSVRWYGLPILHDYGEGEFPRLLAAIRGIVTASDNRLVMVPQEALAKLRVEVPAFAPVIDRLPPPGPTTESCRRQGVCREWSNGWMPFWIKDAAFQSGLTPDLPAAQAYFRRVREGIEEACRTGRLACRDAGGGLLPPFELRWTRALVHALAGVGVLGLLPAADPYVDLPARFNVSPDLGRVFQAVTMASYFDSEAENTLAGSFQRLYRNPLAHLRLQSAFPLLACAALLLVLSFPALAFRWARSGTHPPDALLMAGTVIYAFILLRVAALAYVAVYLGPFESRVMFSSYVVALMLAPLFIAQAWRARIL
jgi:hypothetical protein